MSTLSLAMWFRQAATAKTIFKSPPVWVTAWEEKRKQRVFILIQVLTSNISICMRAKAQKQYQKGGITMKKMMCAALSLALMVSCAPISTAYAEEILTENVELPGVTEDVVLNRPAEDSSELLYNYMLTQSGVTPMPDETKNGVPACYVSGITAGSTLTGNNVAAYNYLKTQIEAIAAGTRTSTRIEIPFSKLNVKTGPWTKTELGVDELISGNSLTDAARQSLRDKVDIDFRAVFLALLADCPYEMYWCKKTNYSFNYFSGCYTSTENGEEAVTMTGGPSLILYVSTDYSVNGADMTTDIPEGQLARVSTAVANAQAIVEANSDKKGRTLLAAYRDAICNATEYNTSAAGGGAPYGDPWQLIYVFDNDKSTNVVCEGYAKAFKYLCDLSGDRLKNISCLTASGLLIDGDVSGKHMWNVVNMDDNRSYLVDITQCDTNIYHVKEFTDTYFMSVPASGNLEEGYTVHFPGAPVTIDGVQYSYPSWDTTYQYDADTLANYQEQYLMLSSEPYVEVTAKEVTLDIVDVNGIRETVNIPDFASYTLPCTKLDGYDFSGWNVNGTQYNAESAAKSAIEELADSGTAITLELVYTKKMQSYVVSVSGGRLSDGRKNTAVQVSNLVTVKADAPEAGKKFSHWLRNSVKVSTNSTYSFRMPGQTVNLEAVFVNDTATVQQIGTAIIESVKPDLTNSKVSFVAVLNIPENGKFVKGGLVATNKSNIGDNVTAENADYVKLSKGTANTKSLKYTWTKGSMTENTIWYVRAYLVYKDENGVEKAVYSDAVKANSSGVIN